MKKRFIFIFMFFCLISVVLFLQNTYISTPGYTTDEKVQEFFKTVPDCYGYSFLLNRRATYADAPGINLCIGVLIK